MQNLLPLHRPLCSRFSLPNIATHFKSFSNFPTNGELLPTSHPHILSPHQIMPGIESVEFMERRCQLMQQLPPKSVVLLPGYGLRYASGPVFHDFQQATNMLYYCGFDEPDSLLVILTLEGNTLPQAILFCQDENPPNVTFHGTNIGPKRAVEHFGIQEAYPSSNLVNFLQTKIAPLLYNATLYLDVDGNTSKAILTPVVSDLIQKMTKGNFKDINIITHKQRSVKSPSELNLLRKAGQAGAAGILAAIRGTAPHLEESDLKNILEFTVRQYRGVEGLSYAPVIASGENALVLHYVKNRHLLEAGQMVLMDAGALYHHYRSDISRTWPINGKFTKPQKEIYQAVLNVHQACIRLCTANLRYSLEDIHDFSFKALQEELLKLNIRVADEQLASIYYPHSIGHYLGLDLHDCPRATTQNALLPGTILTIEPGLYIPKQGLGSPFPIEYQGIGVRIEDDIIVGQDRPEIITSDVPVEITDLEDIIGTQTYKKLN